MCLRSVVDRRRPLPTVGASEAEAEVKLTARQAPRRGGRSAVIAHPCSVRSASRRSARPWALVSQTEPPAPRRFRGRAPAARNPCWSHCPFPGLIGTITPALRGGTSRAAPHVRGTDRRVARPPHVGDRSRCLASLSSCQRCGCSRPMCLGDEAGPGCSCVSCRAPCCSWPAGSGQDGITAWRRACVAGLARPVSAMVVSEGGRDGELGR